MEDILINVEMDKSLVKVEDKVSGVMRYTGGKKGIGWHFENLPLQGFIQKSNKLKGIDGVRTDEQTLEELDVWCFSFGQSW